MGVNLWHGGHHDAEKYNATIPDLFDFRASFAVGTGEPLTDLMRVGPKRLSISKTSLLFSSTGVTETILYSVCEWDRLLYGNPLQVSFFLNEELNSMCVLVKGVRSLQYYYFMKVEDPCQRAQSSC